MTLGLFGQIFAEYAYTACIRADNVHYHPQSRGLARAVRPKKTINTPGRNLRAQVIYRADLPERFAHTIKLQRIHRRQNTIILSAMQKVGRIFLRKNLLWVAYLGGRVTLSKTGLVPGNSILCYVTQDA
jgi:hypothetical protein